MLIPNLLNYFEKAAYLKDINLELFSDTDPYATTTTDQVISDTTSSFVKKAGADENKIADSFQRTDVERRYDGDSEMETGQEGEMEIVEKESGKATVESSGGRL